MNRNIMAAIGLIGLGIVFGIFLVSSFSPGSIDFLHAQEDGKLGAPNAPVQVGNAAKAMNEAFVAASEAVNPTVVSISVEIESKASSDEMREQFREFFKFFGGPEDDGQPRRSEASGSGVIISSDGYIITNNHVVESAIEGGITITTLDKKVYKKAKLIGRDPLTDLALIKIDGEGLQAAHFGNMKDVRIGEFVLAVGNPLGLNSTVTTGIVSAIGRGQLNLGNRDRYSVENFIQTDAAINPGNSGGGLFNLEGSLVGINTAIATRTGTYIGYGFAIPIDLVKSVINDLKEDGNIDRGYIGVSIQTIDETEAKAVGLDKVEGVMIEGVLDDSPADKAGIEIGDVLLELDGSPVRTSNELQSLIVLRRAGDKVKLTIWRDGKKIYKTVRLKARDEEEAVASNDTEDKDETVKEDDPIKLEKLGFSVKPLTSAIKKAYDVKFGVLITKVEKYSIAAERGLFPDGVIVKADRKKVNSPGELKKILNSKDPGEGVLLQVKYKDDYRIVALEIPDA